MLSFVEVAHHALTNQTASFVRRSDHAILQGKYARLYLAEAAYRFNRRFHLREMLPQLECAMMLCKPHPESLLRLADNFLTEIWPPIKSCGLNVSFLASDAQE